MPIYEYECTKCGLIEEAFQKISDKPQARCSDCSGKLRKLISNSSFHLKGSGWYVTDYAKKSSKASRKETTSSPKESSSDASPSSKTEKTTSPDSE